MIERSREAVDDDTIKKNREREAEKKTLSELILSIFTLVKEYISEYI